MLRASSRTRVQLPARARGRPSAHGSLLDIAGTQAKACGTKVFINLSRGNVCVTVREVEVRYYEEDGRAPFEEWFRSVDRSAQARITAAIARLEEGNISNLKSIGGGLHELRMNFGPGYRAYLGRDGPLLIIILTGGTKQRQSRDIAKARVIWDRYKRFAQ